MPGKNCIACSFEYWFNFGIISSAFHFVSSCSHKNEKNDVHLNHSKIQSGIVVAFSIAVLIGGFLTGQRAWKSFSGLNALWTSDVVNVIIYTRTFVVASHFAVKSAKLKDVVMKMQCCVNLWNRWTKESLLPLEKVKELRNTSIFYIGITVIALMLFIIDVYFNRDGPLLVKLINAWSFYADCSLVIGYRMVNELLFVSIKEYQDNLKTYMVVFSDSETIQQRLKEVRFIHNKHGSIINDLNDFYDPLQVIFISFSVLMFVVYLGLMTVAGIVKCWGLIEPIMVLHVTLPQCILLWALFWMDKLMSVSDDLLSFLFKYKISKLKKPAADEVELLIKTLIIRKPVMNASKMFVIHTGLLVPLFKTWFAYFLVGVEKLAAWIITEKVSC